MEKEENGLVGFIRLKTRNSGDTAMIKLSNVIKEMKVGRVVDVGGQMSSATY